MAGGILEGEFATSKRGRYSLLTVLDHVTLPGKGTPILLSATPAPDRRLRVDALISSGIPNPIGVLQNTIPWVVGQAVHDNLNANANIQIGDADISTSNTVPINVDEWGGIDTTLGQKSIATSVPIVLASDQPLIEGAFTLLMSAQLFNDGTAGGTAAGTEVAGSVDLTINSSREVEIEIQIVSAGVGAHRIQFFCRWANDGGTNFAYTDEGYLQSWVYEDTQVATVIYFTRRIKRRGKILRVSGKSTATTGALTFTASIRAREVTSY